MDENSMTDKLDKLSEKIPDIWFDWYGRLIPGCIGIIIYIISFDIKIDANTPNVFLMLFLSYLLGHIAQPVSSGIINTWSSKFHSKKDPIVSKAYAELVGFCSISIFTFLLLLMILIKNTLPKLFIAITNDYVVLIVLFVFFVFSMLLRKKALIRKIDTQQNK